MCKYFNIEGVCNPSEHYMVNLTSRLQYIESLIDKKKYFTINRARQFGKTTTLGALPNFLREKYIVVSLDFQMLSNNDFQSEELFTSSFTRILLRENSFCEAIQTQEIQDQFLSDELIKNSTYSAALKDKNQFIQDGHLNI